MQVLRKCLSLLGKDGSWHRTFFKQYATIQMNKCFVMTRKKT